MMRYLNRALLFSFLLAAGCAFTSEYRSPEVDVPEQWRDADTVIVEEKHQDWWQIFDSDELYGFVRTALAHNTDLAAALHRVAQARAQARIAGAPLYPEVNISGDLSGLWNDPFSSDSSSLSQYRTGMDIAYELDLWGGNRAAAAAAGLRQEASIYDMAALRLIIASDTAVTYTELLAANDRLRITTDQLSTVNETLAIIEVRFREGAASGLEVAQQRTESANLEAEIAAIKKQQSIIASRLAVLTGEPPQTFRRPETLLSDLAAPHIDPFPPADLLIRRPDIRKIETELVAAHADITAARAQLFPSLKLGLNAAVSASPVDSAAKTAAGALASLTAPVFQGGRLRGGVDRAEAIRNELIENYRKAVLVSFQEAEDALSSLKSADQQLEAFQKAVESSALAYTISRERFDAGSIDFLTLLDSQRSLLRSKENLVTARLERISASILLYKALGGGWSRGED